MSTVLDARPLVVIPARFSSSASALRYAAEVTARALVESVWRAGGEPVVVHPDAGARSEDLDARFAFADAVLLPGGGDLHPSHYGVDEEHDALYDVDTDQDAFDVTLASWALERGVPTLAICRGLHVVNAVLGGTLRPHIGEGHRHTRRAIVPEPGVLLASLCAPADKVEISCYHHQAIDRLAPRLRVTARADDGVPEAVESADLVGWFLGVQWHPEDLAAEDPSNQAVFDALAEAGRQHRNSRRP
ncbi:gamma-glutamyl-gamma-aminobutyrate hydrolase family protein [Streptomyces sp. NPDC059460]|uniref:gamma-glutamyl-gamma-aminobutyrate hydrolase family protein n=1 Tax=Streptomyces sp. NPDC059460 TaxID=3346840 RepID=UPI0036BC6049